MSLLKCQDKQINVRIVIGKNSEKFWEEYFSMYDSEGWDVLIPTERIGEGEFRTVLFKRGEIYGPNVKDEGLTASERKQGTNDTGQTAPLDSLVRLLLFAVIAICVFYISVDIDVNPVEIDLGRLCFALVALWVEREILKQNGRIKT